MNLPKNQRELAATLKRVEARVYRRCAEHVRVPNGKTLKEVHEDFLAYARCREDDAVFAETGQGVDMRENLRRMLKEALPC